MVISSKKFDLPVGRTLLNQIELRTTMYVKSDLSERDNNNQPGPSTAIMSTRSLSRSGVKMPNQVTNPQPRRIAVSLQNAWKGYGSGQSMTPVLQGLNMTVPEGTIYSLLGASGCGKTTLLACCVGRKQLDRGNIKIFGSAPGSIQSGVPGKRVGYMPQEIALYTEFTIQEVMQYFGRIYGMSQVQIEEKMNFLISFLNLPSCKSRISELSGGQQRRVSFAVALLSDPEILILDEPTVGVDPLLRQSIWNHLSSLVLTRKTTVVITTHYIEEAKEANTIGLMRSGRLLAEDSPANLLELHQCITLEDVFLKLCVKDKTTENSEALMPNNNNAEARSIYNRKNKRNGIGNDWLVVPEENGIVGLAFHQSKDEFELVSRESGEQKFSSRNPAAKDLGKENRKLSRLLDFAVEDCSGSGPFCAFNPSESMNRLRALIIKNFICMWRNIGFMLFIFVLPAIQVILVCLAIGPEPLDMKFGVVNLEVNETVTDGICSQGPDEEGCMTTNLSCRFLDTLPSTAVHLIPYESDAFAIEDIRAGNLWGYMSFPNNFSTLIVDRGLSGRMAENETIYGSRIRVQMDMSNQQIAFTLQRILLETFRSFSKQLLEDCGVDPISADLPLFFDSPIYGHDQPTFMEYMAPGIMLSIIFFMAVALTGSVFITEKKEGMMDRSLVAGVTTTEVITAHMITQYVIMIGQTALVLIFMIAVFKLPVRGPLGWAIVITLLQGTCGMTFGFLISALCNEERKAIQLALGSFYPNLLLSGVVCPIESMPPILQDISYFFPETLACESMRSMLSRGWGISHPAVWPGFAASIIWSLVFWILTIFVARFSRSK